MTTSWATAIPWKPKEVPRRRSRQVKMLSIKMTDDDLGDLLTLMMSAINSKNGPRFYFDSDSHRSESATDKARRIFARINKSTGKGLILPDDLPESVKKKVAANPGKAVGLTKREQSQIAKARIIPKARSK